MVLSLVVLRHASIISPGSTFNDPFQSIIKSITADITSYEVERIDIVIDQYGDISIKYPTRCARKSNRSGHKIPF